MSLLTAVSRNSLLLGLFAAVTTGLIAITFLGTRDDILEAERAAEARQLLEIFPKETHDNNVVDDRFELAANTPLLGLRTAGHGYKVRQGNRVVGVILPATARDGYSGDIRLLVGVNADGRVAGVRVVTHKETPGLGDAIDLRKSPWVLDFNGHSLNDPLPSGWAVAKDDGIFDQFTGATITPRAVVNATRKVLEYVELHQQVLFDTTSAHTSGNSAS
jgi:electron transport complex protein RnfG